LTPPACSGRRAASSPSRGWFSKLADHARYPTC